MDPTKYINFKHIRNPHINDCEYYAVMQVNQLCKNDKELKKARIKAAVRAYKIKTSLPVSP